MAATLERQSSGLLGFSDIDLTGGNFVAGDWEAQANATVEIDAASPPFAFLKLSEAAGWAFVRYTVTGAVSKCVVCGEWAVQGASETGEVQIGAGMETGAAGNQIACAWATVGGGTEFAGVREREDSSSVTSTDAVGVTAKSSNTHYRQSLFFDGPNDTIEGYDHDSAANRTKADLSALTTPSGHPGISFIHSAGASIRFYSWYVWADLGLSCSGLPTGHKLKLRKGDATVLKTATESGGVATIPTLLDVFPREFTLGGDLVVTDAADSVLATFASPADVPIAGDDTYLFTPDSPAVVVPDRGPGRGMIGKGWF